VKSSSARIPAISVPKKNRPAGFFIDLALLSFSALLFALSFPSFLSNRGWWPLAFICLAPMFYAASRASWKLIAFYGAFFGFFSYMLFNFWLAKFHPLAIIIVPVIYLTYFLVLFPFLRAAAGLFPRYGYILQVFLWLSYEFLRTQGFLGYSYGILGYSQYLFNPLIQLSEITGVWGVSFLVVFPSAFLASAVNKEKQGIPSFFRRHRGITFLYAGIFFLVLIYGFVSPVDLKDAKLWKAALIQHNVDPWKGGVRAYRQNLDRLIHLSREVIKEKPDIVIWSETAFVPGIDWHTRYREDHEIYDLVDELKRFLGTQKVPYVFGNDDGRLGKDREGNTTRIDYNAAILYHEGRIIDIYRKLHLVPFTENFPFEKELPGIYQWLKDADTHFWEKGTEYTIFNAGGVNFATPICFEDTFGYLSRNFVREGAEVIVNLTNDSWSGSVASAMQHLGMAVFRAVENRRSLIRSSNGGMTGIIDPNGKIQHLYKPFIEGFLVEDVPVYTGKTTLYTRWGDWFAYVCLAVSGAVLTIGSVLRIVRGKRKAEYD
jgi:apolipoprotein N-acyltransferase